MSRRHLKLHSLLSDARTSLKYKILGPIFIYSKRKLIIFALSAPLYNAISLCYSKYGYPIPVKILQIRIHSVYHEYLHHFCHIMNPHFAPTLKQFHCTCVCMCRLWSAYLLDAKPNGMYHHKTRHVWRTAASCLNIYGTGKLYKIFQKCCRETNKPCYNFLSTCFSVYQV